MNQPDEEQPEPKRDRFRRWQKITLGYFGYTINLVLTFTIAALGYWFTLLKDDRFTPGASARFPMFLSLAALALSAIGGFACILNRLRDFSGTTQRAGDKPGAPEKDDLDDIGELTWYLFYFQIGMFAAGTIALATALLLTYGCKLI